MPGAEAEALPGGDPGLDRVGLGARELARRDRGLDLVLERALEGVLEGGRRDAEAAGGVVDDRLALVGAAKACEAATAAPAPATAASATAPAIDDSAAGLHRGCSLRTSGTLSLQQPRLRDG